MDRLAVPSGRLHTRAAARRRVAPRGWLSAAAAVTVALVAMTVAAAAVEAATETSATAAGVDDKAVGPATAGVLGTSVHANWYARCGSRYDTCTEAVRCYDHTSPGCSTTPAYIADKCCSCYSACKKSGRRKYRERCRTRSKRFGRTC